MSLPAVKVFPRRLQMGEAWGQMQSEPVQDGEVGPVDAVPVAGDRGRRDGSGVVIANIEYVVTFVFVGAHQFGWQRDVVGQERIGDHALAASEIFARVARLDGRIGGFEFLTVDASVEHFPIERIVRKDREPRNEVADPVVGLLERRQAQILLGSSRDE